MYNIGALTMTIDTLDLLREAIKNWNQLLIRLWLMSQDIQSILLNEDNQVLTRTWKVCLNLINTFWNINILSWVYFFCKSPGVYHFLYSVEQKKKKKNWLWNLKKILNDSGAKMMSFLLQVRVFDKHDNIEVLICSFHDECLNEKPWKFPTNFL